MKYTKGTNLNHTEYVSTADGKINEIFNRIAGTSFGML